MSFGSRVDERVTGSLRMTTVTDKSKEQVTKVHRAAEKRRPLGAPTGAHQIKFLASSRRISHSPRLPSIPSLPPVFRWSTRGPVLEPELLRTTPFPWGHVVTPLSSGRAADILRCAVPCSHKMFRRWLTSSTLLGYASANLRFAGSGPLP
jgi:hypothetical protein